MILNEFTNYGWTLKTHTPLETVYVYEDNEFTIENKNDRIIVKSPIKNSNYIYRTSFAIPKDATRHILAHLDYFMQKIE